MISPGNTHVKYLRDPYEFRVFADRIEIEGPDHLQTLDRAQAQLYYEFFIMLNKDLEAPSESVQPTNDSDGRLCPIPAPG